MTQVAGGKSIYGASVGILMLDARFPRIPGDMGNAETWPFPVHYKIVRDASPDRVVRKGAEGLKDSFIAAAQELICDGADGITTNCGFLSLMQDDLSKAISKPVVSSSLMQVEFINRILPMGKVAGIMTISGSTLSEAHLRAANVPLGTPMASTEGGREFSRVILNDEPVLDVDAARADNVDCARQLVANHPEIGAIVLECTNMTPYATTIRDTVGLPVFSMVSLVSWFQSGLMPRRYPLTGAPE